MAFAKKTLMVFLLMLVALCGASMAALYEVGDSAGWTNTGHVDYKTWSASKNFHVGDTILFKYNNKFHNVIRVTHKNFNACNATAPYAIFTTGRDEFTLRKEGHFYFICSFPGHCDAGQKVDIRVPQGGSNSPSPLRRAPSYTPHPVPQMPSPSPLTLPVPLPSPSLNPVPSHSPSLSPGHSRLQPSPSSSPLLSPSPTSYMRAPHSFPAPAQRSSPAPQPASAPATANMAPSISPAYPLSLPPSLSPSSFSQTGVPAPHNNALPHLLSIELWSSVVVLAHFVFLL